MGRILDIVFVDYRMDHDGLIMDREGRVGRNGNPIV